MAIGFFLPSNGYLCSALTPALSLSTGRGSVSFALPADLREEGGHLIHGAGGDFDIHLQRTQIFFLELLGVVVVPMDLRAGPEIHQIAHAAADFTAAFFESHGSSFLIRIVWQQPT